MSVIQKAFSRLHYLPILLLSTYALFLALILHPEFQAHNVYLHGINFPFHYDLSKPQKVRGLIPGRVRNFRITTSDGIQIAGWHLLPNDVHAVDADNASVPSEGQESFDEALCERPTVLYFHGNAMNRAAPFRIQAYGQFTALNINVVAIDYRGFGDSQGKPSEEGLQRDARAAYKWIRERQRKVLGDWEKNEMPAIYIAGQSLGTGVATRLTLDLVQVGRAPDALFLIAPYTSIFNLLTSYKIGGLLPIFWPIGLWKVLSDLAERHLYTRFESDKALYQIVKGGPSHLDASENDQYGNLDYQLSTATLMQELAVTSPQSSLLPPNIIISHADDDAVIPHSHGRSLLDTIALALGESKEKQINTIEQPWGHTLTLLDASHDRTFVLVKSHKGGHNGVPQHTVEIFRTIVGLKK